MAKKSEDRVFTLEFFRRQGALGGKLGGMKASENMTQEQRRARALKAVAARKSNPVLTEEEKARRAAAKRPVGRPRKVVAEASAKMPRGRPKKAAE